MAKKDKIDTLSLEQMIETKLKRVLNDREPPDKETLMAINTAIKFVAVQHKIGEDAWGSEFSNFDEDETDGTESRIKPTDTDGHAGSGREPGAEDT